jgi:hypothetical protein
VGENEKRQWRNIKQKYIINNRNEKAKKLAAASKMKRRRNGGIISRESGKMLAAHNIGKWHGVSARNVSVAA